MCEDDLLGYASKEFVPMVIRPATVCGHSPRQRLDVIVNIMTNHAINNRKVKVFGGEQLRPNIHIQDMVEVYSRGLRWRDDQVASKIYNAGYQNHSVSEIADIVRNVVGEDVAVETTPTDDIRSYHVSSDKIKRELDFSPAHTIEDAVKDLKRAFTADLLPNSFEDSSYFNIKRMQEVNLQ